MTTRTKLLRGLAACAALSLLFLSGGCKMCGMGGDEKCTAWKEYKNEDFYKEDGTFDQAKAKQAFYEMFEYHGYPIFDRLKTDEFWVNDFGLGKFTEIGMGGIFWINRKDDDYFGHEIYLLPGQSIPEHKHVETEEARPKMEAWQVRHGWVTLYSEGEPTPGFEKNYPPSHLECGNAKTEQKVMPGELGYLGGPSQWHFQKAGPDGAIVTEYASYHDGAALRFSHPDVTLE